MSNRKRPKSITAICIVLLAMSVLSFFLFPINFLKVLFSPELYQVFQEIRQTQGCLGVMNFVLSIIATIIYIGSAIAMLFGFNWARWLYLIFAGSYIVSGWLFGPGGSPTAKFIGFGIYVVFFYYLTRPDASAFFYSKKQKDYKLNNDETKELSNN